MEKIPWARKEGNVKLDTNYNPNSLPLVSLGALALDFTTIRNDNLLACRS